MSQSRTTSYSELLKNISTGEVDLIRLNPQRREAEVLYLNGTTVKVPVLYNDQYILNAIKESGTKLTVIDYRSEAALAGMTANIGFIFILFLGLLFILKRAANLANRTMSFGKSSARTSPSEIVDVTFDDVAGINEAKEELEEIVTFLKKPEKVLKLGAKIPRGYLLQGPPGTGKTLLAKAIAGEASVPFFSIAASEFVELFVGVGASRVRDLFKKAKEKAPCIIFIDEIDSVGRQRGSGIGGGNDEREQTLNQLLTEMDGFADNAGIIVIAATNRQDILDSALTRPGRFDRRIDVSLPDRLSREKILSVHARSKPLSKDVCFKNWAVKTPGFSGADLSNLLNEAAILTARENKKLVNNSQIELALERITMGLSVKPLQDCSKKRLIAYHEVGHALVAAYTPYADKVDKISLIPKGGGLGGYTRFHPNEENLDSGLITKAYLSANIIVSMGGRAAELIVFGKDEITQGASGDFENVSRLAREMVTRFGFSSLGPIALEFENRDIFIGSNMLSKNKKYADSTGTVIDNNIRKIAIESMNKAINILKDKRKLMDKLVDTLIEEETIDGDRFLQLAGLQSRKAN